MKNKTIFLNNFVYAMLILLLAFVSTFFVTSQNGSNNVSHGATTPIISASWTDSASRVDTVWDGAGSPTDPYLITSAEELTGLAYQVNNGNNYAGVYFRLRNNINLRSYYWTPIGNSSTNYFAGNFDGNGYTIFYMIVQANLYSYSGLFGYVRYSGSNSIILEDIVIEDSYISGGVTNGYVGMIAGYCYFNDSCRIIDCTSERENEIEVNTGYTGGIVGGLIDGTMDNCRNGCTIAGAHVGGIVGYTAQDSVINRCYNYGSVSGNGHVGGICGYSNDIRVNECLNAMDVTSTSQYAGGIVGCANTLFIRNCYNDNSGDIDIDIEGYLGAGGIVGYYQDQYNTISTIANCYNRSTVYSRAGDVGGILGLGDGYTIYNCFNIGATSNLAAGTFGGGIVGYDYNRYNSNIYGCWYGGSCKADYGIGSSRSNTNTRKHANLNSLARASGFYYNSNWTIDSNNYYWDMTAIWALDASYDINSGFPYLIDSSYEITYLNDGHCTTGDDAPTSAYRGQVIHISNPVIAEEGYHFRGASWFAESGLDTLMAYSGSSYSSLTRFTMENIATRDEYFSTLAIDRIIFSAKTYPNNYYVTLVYNNGQASSRQFWRFGSLDEIPTPTRNGYVFAGWTISGSYNLTTARQGTSSNLSYTTGWSSTTSSRTSTWFGSLATTHNADVTLTAQWELATYDITYNVNGGDRVTGNNYAITRNSNSTNNGVTFSYNNITDITTLNGTASATTRCFTSEVFTDSLPNSFTVGYNLLSGSFSGTLEFRIFSSTGTSLGSYSFSDGYASDEASLSLTGSASRWMFQLNIGSGATFDNAQFKFFCYNSSQTPSSKFTYTHYQPLAYAEREGYAFMGWNTQVNGSGMTYSPANIGTSYTNLTLYAQWTPASYTVTFDANGGTTDITRMNVKYLSTFGSGNGGELPYAENEWFILEGWFVDGAGEAILPSTIFTYTEHINLIAQWKDTWFNHGTKPEGEGSASSPYLIAFPEHLGWLSSQVAQGLDTTSYCRQVANIELSRTSSGFYEQEWYPIGTETHPFRGTYDGNGYKIGLTSQNCRLEYYGLFGVISDATITKVYFEGDSLTSGETAGGLVAYAVGTSIISDCYLEVTLDNALEVNNFTFGAIVGYGGANCQIVRCSLVFNDNVGTDYPIDNATINPIANGNIEIVSVYYRYCTPSSTEHLYAGSDYLNGFVFSDDFLVPMSENLVWFPAENSPVTQAEVQAWVNRA